MNGAYLTIDDSPSPDMAALCAFLQERAIPALFFCRGDLLAADPDPVIAAIRQGFVIGNHAFSHTRFSTFSLAQGIEEIEKTECLIDHAYQKAGRARPGKYFRFPHLDRGAGGWVVDYAAAGAHRKALEALFTDGLNIDLTPPPPALTEKKAALQDWLARAGFTVPFSGVTWKPYAESEMAKAYDCLMTCSTADWMLTPRHSGKWPYKTVEDLQAKLDDDPALQHRHSRQVILLHDQPDLLPVTISLINHMIGRNIKFLPPEG